MRILVFLVGVQGSGKTTLLGKMAGVCVLKPSTSRARREGEGEDYHFETNWDSNLLAWEITRGEFKYGMRLQELDRIRDLGVTVFDPARLADLQELKKKLPEFEIISVGLDTIDSILTQNARVGHDTVRCITGEQDFACEIDAIRRCDVVLSGTENVVFDAFRSLVEVCGGRGGLVHGLAIRNLITAGALLEGATVDNVQSASYDLRLGNKYWCQGQYRHLDEKNNTAQIPPYSYILAQAKEYAALPKFIAGSFDTTVTLFLHGVILSNGPQVDPGYSGALFCMLYNTSDRPVGIHLGQHFATLQFNTIVRSAKGYDAQYQGKRSFEDFLDAHDSLSPGGRIFERIEEVKREIKDDIKSWRQAVIGVAGIAVAVSLGAGVFAYNISSKAALNAEEAAKNANLAAQRLERLGLPENKTDPTKNSSSMDSKYNEKKTRK